MNTEPNNYHVSSMPALRTTTIQATPKARKFRKGDAIIVLDMNEVPYAATYEGTDGTNRALISINGSRTSVMNYKIKHA